MLRLLKYFNGAITYDNMMDNGIDFFNSMIACYEEDAEAQRKANSRARGQDIISKMRGR